MYISSFKAVNWRNLKETEIKPAKGVNVIYGENAQGKTNLVEGIYAFSGEKSFRNATDREQKEFNSEFAKLNIEFRSHRRKQTAEIVIEQKKSAKLNGVAIKTATELSTQCHIIVFSPDLLQVIKEGPKERRNFLNTGICGVYLNYSGHYRKYNRLLMQRNALLKEIRKNTSLAPLLDEYDKMLSIYGSHLIKTRKRYIKKLMQYMPEIYCDLTKKRETIDLRYVLNGVETDEDSALLTALKNNREQDILSGSTSVGPHRDDIEFIINGVNAKNYGSQGQQRSAVLAVKLAEAEIIKEICGEQPIAILDDVMSELDHHRQDYILNHIKKWQVFITCCDPSTVKRLKNGKLFKVEKGVITEETVEKNAESERKNVSASRK